MGFGDRLTASYRPRSDRGGAFTKASQGFQPNQAPRWKPWDRDRRHGGPSPTVKGRHTASHRQAQAGKAELWPACGPGR